MASPPPLCRQSSPGQENTNSPLDRIARNIILDIEGREQEGLDHYSNIDEDIAVEFEKPSGFNLESTSSSLPHLPSLTTAFPHHQQKKAHPQVTSRRPSYVVSSIVVFFGGLKRLLDRNPTTVTSGRYTIHFRQGLIIMVLLISLTTFWLLVTGANAFGGILDTVGDDLDSRLHNQVSNGDRQRKFMLGKNWRVFNGSPDPSLINGNKGKFIYPQFVPSPDDTPTARDRFERVRGRGAHSDLAKIQFDFPAETTEERDLREQRRLAVKAGFEHAWNGYKSHAWGHDEVLPVSGGSRDSFNGWGATMIDSLDTMVIMGLNKEFDEALEWVRTSFTMTKNPKAHLQFFETVIRYLGGLLSSYDLTGEKVLLDKAKELGGHLLNAFGSEISNTHQPFPSGRVIFDPETSFQALGGTWHVLAEIGTIQVEFTRLSRLTGDLIFEEKARKVFDLLGSQEQQLPGLMPANVQSVQKHRYEFYDASLGGMIDSYYEYLLKEWILLDGEEDAEGYKDSFLEAAESIHRYMVSQPDDGSEDYAIVGKVSSSSQVIQTDMEHLACFISGSLAMSSKYFNRPQDLILAKKIAEACYQSYHRSETGLGPESFRFLPEDGSGGKVFKVESNTFYFRGLSRTEYILRPETVESLWILYRLTGEKKYQEQAWEIFESLERSCRTEIAYSGLRDVNTQWSHDNKMESFFMAETMKYLYLMFSTPDVISLDDFVLNTEAHPILRTL